MDFIELSLFIALLVYVSMTTTRLYMTITKGKHKRITNQRIIKKNSVANPSSFANTPTRSNNEMLLMVSKQKLTTKEFLHRKIN